MYFKQTADLDVSKYWWTPIGVYYDRTGAQVLRSFVGNYDGNGHTISGIFTKAGTDNANSYQGLFGLIDGQRTRSPSIANLGIINSNIQGNSYIGGLVGDSAYGLTMRNCYNTGIVGGSTRVGGLVGYMYFTRVTACFNTGEVTGSTNVGGLIGENNGTVINCYNSGSVSGSGTSPAVGGLAGDSSYSTIMNCYNIGNVSGSSSYLGGIAGYASSPSISYCYYGGNCLLSAGVGNGSGTTTRDSNLITNVQTLSWYQDSSKWNSSYPWDFENTWYIINEKGISAYPRLQAFGLPTNWIELTADNFEGGTGVENDPYQIKYATQLAYLAQQVNAGTSYSGQYFKQVADLDLGGYNWTPIGEDYFFMGNYDGNSFFIYNLTMSGREGGLYGGIKNSVIENVYLRNLATVSVGICGGIAGTVEDVGEIKNCHVEGYIESYDLAGGILGNISTFETISNIKIVDCTFSGKLKCIGDYVGGIVGRVQSGQYLIQNCTNEGDISGTLYIGGILGADDEWSSTTGIENCKNFGNITSSNSIAGGIVGAAAIIKNCVSEGMVKGSIIGGIAGNAKTIENCVAKTNLIVSGSGKVGSIAGEMFGKQSTITNCSFVGGCNFSAIFTYAGGAKTVTNCYAIINRKKYYSDGDFSGMVRQEGVNNGMPVVKNLYHVAQFMDGVNADWFAENGFTLAV